MINYQELELFLCDVIRACVGTMLTQATDDQGSYGIVLTKRPKGDDALIPDYPYAVIDHLFTQDVEGPNTTVVKADDSTSYCTLKEVNYQIDVYGSRYDTMQITNTLESRMGLPHIVRMFESQRVGVRDREAIRSNPELYDTNFIEKGVFILSLYVFDEEVDTFSGKFDSVHIQNSHLINCLDEELPVDILIEQPPTPPTP